MAIKIILIFYLVFNLNQVRAFANTNTSASVKVNINTKTSVNLEATTRVNANTSVKTDRSIKVSQGAGLSSMDIQKDFQAYETTLSFEDFKKNLEPLKEEFFLKTNKNHQLKRKTQSPFILLYFFASYCSICEKELPEFIKQFEALSPCSGEIYAISLDEKAQDYELSKRDWPIKVDILWDKKDILRELFKIKRIPTLVYWTQSQKKMYVAKEATGVTDLYTKAFALEKKQCFK